jgi:sugar phosphate isomerase/epimerase
MTRVGAAADIRFEASVDEFMAFVADLGLDHVEFKREYLAARPEPLDPARIGDLADDYGLSVTFHAPFRDWNMGSFNDAARQGAVDRVKATLDDAAAAGAGGVVVHGGSVPRRYPAHVREQARQHARQSLREAAAHAADVGVPLCLENQPRSDTDRRYTTTPDDLAGSLDVVDAPGDALGVTLDVGHAKANGVDWRRFVDRFEDRIRVVHLHDNDGSGDDHDPISDYRSVVEAVDAPYAVLEMKSLTDVRRSVRWSEDGEPRPGSE